MNYFAMILNSTCTVKSQPFLFSVHAPLSVNKKLEQAYNQTGGRLPTGIRRLIEYQEPVFCMSLYPASVNGPNSATRLSG